MTKGKRDEGDSSAIESIPRLAQGRFLCSTSQCVLRPWGLLTRGIGLVGVRADRFCRIALSGSDLVQLEILDAEAALVCLDLVCRHMLWRLPTHYCNLSMTRCAPAFYDCMLKLGWGRFLLADDGETISSFASLSCAGAHFDRLSSQPHLSAG